MPIQFRPHHFLCTLGFQGKGYSPAFVENYQVIVDELSGPDGEQVSITVVAQADSICAPCPNKRGVLCTSQAKITALDKAHAQILQLKAGDVLSWGEAKARIANAMSLEKFNKACAVCGWKELGVCEQALKKLLCVPV